MRTEPRAIAAPGTRDYLAPDVKHRTRIFALVSGIFERFGFVPLETPAFERLEVLTGKYGEEGEGLIFKILRRGEAAATGEADLALRYDLTIPLVRVLSQHQHELPRPFKRYQIGPVWRADRPGKGRYREFFQCDVDTVGVSSRLADAEIILALAAALHALDIRGFTVRLNSRVALRGLLDAYGVEDDMHRRVLTVLDKLDKTSLDEIERQLTGCSLSSATVEALMSDLRSDERAQIVRERLRAHDVGAAGLSEVDEIISLVGPLLDDAAIVFDPFLARGLDYYTGPIFEIYAAGSRSAIAGGGRYDDLIGLLTGKDTPACGGSLGIERILTLTRENKPPISWPAAQVMVGVWNAELRADSLRIAADLRAAGVATELYLGEGRVGKQLQHAAGRNIPLVVLLGPEDKKKNEVVLRDLTRGRQETFARDDLLARVRGALDTIDTATDGNPTRP
jgi:histidyl-tRNA synthetase